MSNLESTIKKVVEYMAFEESEVRYDEEKKKIAIYINDSSVPFIKANLPAVVSDFNVLGQLIAKKCNEQAFFIDINNYQVERERIIVELAKAAARKVMATKEEISLPAMNAYERRLVHTELAANPEIKTESIGEGRERKVVIKLI